VGHELDVDHFPAIVTTKADRTWADDIQTATEIEQRLWTAYEQRFTAAHERNLAYRYEPANDEELAIVLKYFPPVHFQLKKDVFVVTYAGMILPGQTEVMSWDSVTELKYEDASLSADVLEITHPEKKWIGNKTTKVKLPAIKKQKETFKAILGHYLQRHRIMRQQIPAG
jgi:hypothetical protein